MNVGPARFSEVAIDVQESAPQVRPAPLREVQKTQEAAPAASIEQDEVKVQWDTSAHLRIYQFVNQSGALILQVPSEQVLGVSRGIRESLQNKLTQQENARQAEATIEGAGSTGAGNNGN